MIKKSENIYEIKKKGMNVPGRIFASDLLIKEVEEKTLEQIENVAKLPGIVEASFAMPDAHMGYGFCVGGVAAFDIKRGIISPGGIGYDINCGVRLIRTDIDKEDFLKKRKEIAKEIKNKIPSGVGKKGNYNLDLKELDEILETGVNWAVKNGYATKKDLENCEDQGCIKGADSTKVSQKAKGRGRNQICTLGAGNHFLEIQFVDEIFDNVVAKVFGLKKDKICVLIHSGSRGLGHQTASDYIRAMEEKFGWKNLPDRELACAPIDSQLGKDYISAMRSAANFAFVNRQLMMFAFREIFKKYFPKNKLELVYDVAHNIAKFEKYNIEGKKIELCVHRKGATRSFGPGRKEIPKCYQKSGQPIFIPGSMGTSSFVLVGTKESEKISFSSTAHGAGRVLSRSRAKNSLSAEKIIKDLEKNNIYLQTDSFRGIVEEAPEAYKDVEEVVEVSHKLKLGKKVARLKPLAVIKG